MEIPIDIPLPDALVQRLTPPTCADLELPEPSTLNLCSPFGGAKFQGIVDVTKGIPDDCALTFSILLQLPPFMVSLGCFVKLLKVMGPLMKFVKGVPDIVTKGPGEIISALEELVPAIADVVACFVSLVAGVPMFVKDLILLIAKLLKCISEQIKSLAELMNGLDISIKSAEAAGNKALMQQLQCAKDNAHKQGQAAMGSVDIIAVVMAMAEPLLELAPGLPKIAIPSFGTAEDAFALEQAANTMLSVSTSLVQIAQALPSC